jgi:AraC-like DNA-binding protein
MAKAALGDVLLLSRMPDTDNSPEKMLALLAALSPQPKRNGNRPKWLLDVERRISSNPAATINDIAEEVGLHPVYLSRVFASWNGVTPVVYRQQQRTSAAISALLSGQFAAQVAQDSGFADQSHMCRAIKSSTGRSISELQAARRAAHCRPIPPCGRGGHVAD